MRERNVEGFVVDVADADSVPDGEPELIETPEVDLALELQAPAPGHAILGARPYELGFGRRRGRCRDHAIRCSLVGRVAGGQRGTCPRATSAARAAASSAGTTPSSARATRSSTTART